MAVIVSIIVIIFLAFFFFRGFKKGFLKVILTTMSLVVTLVVSSFLLTPVSNFLAENTNIEKNMEKSIEKRLGWDTPSESLPGVDLSAIENIEDDALRAQAEEAAIEELKLPGIIKNAVLAKNNISDYITMGVENFKQYIIRSIAMVELKIFTYIALVVAIYILLRLLLLASKVITKIPVIKGINKFLGGIAGLIKGLLIIWVISLFISLISQTPFGSSIVDMIHSSGFLTFLYEQNLILKLAGALFTLF